MIKNKDELYTSKNFSKLLKLNGFIKIPFHLATYYSLSPAECMIYAFIDNATKNLSNKAFTDNETTLQALCNVSKGTIQKSLKNLQYKGLIEKAKEKTADGRTITVYRSLRNIQERIRFTDTP